MLFEGFHTKEDAEAYAKFVNGIACGRKLNSQLYFRCINFGSMSPMFPFAVVFREDGKPYRTCDDD